MRKIYIHIGSHKTATSSIQKYLSEKSKNIGFLYPKSGLINSSMHHAVAYDLLYDSGNNISGLFYGNNIPGNVWESLEKELQKNPKKDVIISSEEFFSIYARSGTKPIKTLNDRLKKFGEIKIILYLRRQDYFCESSYNQNIKFSKWTGDFCDQMKNLDTLKYNYLEIVEAWGNIFGTENIIIRPFEVDALKNSNVISDFLNVLGSQYSEDIDAYYENEKIPDELIELKRCINFVNFPFPQYREDVNNFILRLKRVNFKNKIRQMPKHFYQEMLPEWSEINEKISTKYLKGNSLFHNSFQPSNEINFLDDNPEEFRNNLIAVCESALCDENLSDIDESFIHSIVIKGSLIACSTHNITPNINSALISRVLQETDKKLNRDLAFFRNQMFKYKKIAEDHGLA